jgi:hypothetical protein
MNQQVWQENEAQTVPTEIKGGESIKVTVRISCAPNKFLYKQLIFVKRRQFK